MFSAVWKAPRLKIRKAQEASWSPLYEQVDSNPWELPYRIVAKSLRRTNPGVAGHRRELEFAAALFPSDPLTDWGAVPIPAPDRETAACTANELATSARRLPPGNSIGPGGVPNEALAALEGDGSTFI